MPLRVEELAARAETSVDTIRYYQARNLLPAPTRVGRVAWYGDEHLARLARIRQLQARGFSLAVIHRLVAGELDHADEELIAALASETDHGPAQSGGPDRTANSQSAWLTLEQLAERSGIPLVVLDAVVREGLLVAHRVQGEDRYSEADVTAAAAGLCLLEQGLPLADLLALARDHSIAMRATAQRAVELFDRHIRQALREEGTAEDVAAERLVTAFETILPATLTLVSHHFHRTLLAVALEHLEAVGTDGERQLVSAAAQRST